MSDSAFPDPWVSQQAKAQSAGKGKQKGNGKGRGKGKDKGKRGANRFIRTNDIVDIEMTRLEELQEMVQELAAGREPNAVARPGDAVEVLRVLGTDPLRLAGRRGDIVGVVPTGPSGRPAATVHFGGDGEAFGTTGMDLTFEVADLRIVQPVLPLDEGSRSFPKALNGLERKAVHAEAERLGLVSKSFGEGEERYITVYRPADKTTSASAQVLEPENDEVVWADTCVSGVVLDDTSHTSLLVAIGIVPNGWKIRCDRFVICAGPLSRPQPLERRRQSVMPAVLQSITELSIGQPVRLRVVSIARDERALAVGVLANIPCTSRNPHIIVGLGPDVEDNAAARIPIWQPWTGAPLELHGTLAQWDKTTGRADKVTPPQAERTGDAQQQPALIDTSSVEAPGIELLVHVKPMTGEMFTVCAKAEGTIGALKTSIEELNVEFPAARTRLVYAGQVLDDSKLTREYNITGAIVAVVKKP
eukprot:TRINITY_DN75305_c0_g1_i1.p1 TRINITY_DN75305_c0_g1~~TRINITY_DN75305_c0_g1_i1.p1  ORF type:complete len:474 (-),score=5.20 TRINITY_DN75305_c0_g1_i1:16-1437(-)